jgi:hypothetical protein
MARTPDRFPGTREEEEIHLEDLGPNPTSPGGVTYNGGAFAFKDAVGTFDPRTGDSGLTPTTHRSQDQLVHVIAEDSFDQFVYTGNKIDAVITWTTSGMTQKIREELYTYTGNKVTQVVTKQYDGAGVLIVGETMTEAIAYSGGSVSDISRAIT